MYTNNRQIICGLIYAGEMSTPQGADPETYGVSAKISWTQSYFGTTRATGSKRIKRTIH